jgi:hypothetical protein
MCIVPAGLLNHNIDWQNILDGKLVITIQNHIAVSTLDEFNELIKNEFERCREKYEQRNIC